MGLYQALVLLLFAQEDHLDYEHIKISCEMGEFNI